VSRWCSRGDFLAPLKRRRFKFALVLLVLAVPPASLTSQAKDGQNTASSATVNFTLDFPHSEPEHYSIAVESNGHSRYESGAGDDAYTTEFDISEANRAKIFEWAKQASYFAGNLDSGNHRLAFTGTKILSYHDAQRDNTARYDYSKLAPVQALTGIFQSIAATLEFGRHITYYHRYQKLALDDELKQMEEEARANELSELQAVAPVLQQIVDDSSVINVVRARAKSLIELGNTPATTSGRNQR
jgi:hypothetical protein